MTDDNRLRNIPSSDLDMQMQVTDPAWQNLHPELQEKLIRLIGKEIRDKEEKEIYERLSSILAIYTRDLRLGNLSSGDEFIYVSYYIELSVDLLLANMAESTIAAINKSLSILELSSSKRGFLRKLFNTFRHEDYSSVLEPEKRNLMGSGQNRQGGYKK